LFKLYKTLCVFQLDDENTEDIIALARYAYSEEGGGGGLDEGIGGLRSLVSHAFFFLTIAAWVLVGC
jgi:hypothetical protein